MRETYMWSKVKHENIQQLLGITMLHGRLGMLSLWREHGNLQNYLRKFPSVDRYQLVNTDFIRTSLRANVYAVLSSNFGRSLSTQYRHGKPYLTIHSQLR